MSMQSVPLSARMPRASLRLLAAAVQGVVFLTMVIVLALSFLVSLCLPVEIQLAYVRWFADTFGVISELSLQYFPGHGFAERALTLFFAHIFVFGIAVMCMLPFVGLLVPRWWGKALVTTALFWLCGEWILAALLPLQAQVAYLHWLADIGVVSDVVMQSFPGQGFAERGLTLFFAHVELTLVAGIIVIAATPVLAAMAGIAWLVWRVLGKKA